MDTIFMNYENSKTSDPHRLLFNLTDRINVKRRDYTWENIKKSYINSKIKISAPAWNEELELLNGSYSVSDIRDYFTYMLKRYETVTDNPSIKIYLNKIENRITFKKRQDIILSS